MAGNEITRALFGEAGEGFARGTALGTQEAFGKVTQEALAEEWSISPYRVYMASFMGGDIGKMGKNITKDRRSISVLNNELKDLKSQIKDVRRTGKRKDVEIKTVERKEGLEFAKTKEAMDSLAKLLGKKVNYKIEKTQDGLSAIRKFYIDNGGSRDMTSFLNALSKAGIDTGEQAELKAEKVSSDIDSKVVQEEKAVSKLGSINELIKEFNKKVDEHDKTKKSVRRLQKDFNKFVPKKTELERLVGLKQNMDIATLRRLFTGGRDTESVEKRRVHAELVKSLRTMKKDFGLAPIKRQITDEKGRIKLIDTSGRLEQILNNLESEAKDILNPRFDFRRASEIEEEIRRKMNLFSVQSKKGGIISRVVNFLTGKGGETVVPISEEDLAELGFGIEVPGQRGVQPGVPVSTSDLLRTR